MIQRFMKKNRQHRKDKKLQAFLKRLKSQKLLNVLHDKNDYKIWVDIKVILNELLQTMINSEITDNYISHETVQQLELILQQQ